MKDFDALNAPEKWEKAFDHWVKSPAESTSSRDLLPNIYKQINLSQTEDYLDAELDSLLSEHPVSTSDRFLSEIRAQLREDKKISIFPQIIRWATPIAAAAALTFALMSQTKQDASPASDPVIAQFEPKNLQKTMDPELVQIFALASNLQSDTNITIMAESMETYAMLVD